MTGTVCPRCGRLWVCMTGTAGDMTAKIQTMEQARCPVCKGVHPAQDDCKTCNGTGFVINCGCEGCEEPDGG
jgi:membrane protease subunit (stomatin/prohibitin family)